MTAGEREVQASITIHAPASTVFSVIDDPSQHHCFDGSNTVRGLLKAPDKLTLGDTFTMRMKIGVPYSITNTVVEYEKNRLLAWRHFGRHIWRYELEPIGDDETKVTETFDYSPSLWPRGLELLDYPERNRRSISQTLTRLKDYVESKDAGHHDH